MNLMSFILHVLSFTLKLVLGAWDNRQEYVKGSDEGVHRVVVGTGNENKRKGKRS